MTHDHKTDLCTIVHRMVISSDMAIVLVQKITNNGEINRETSNANERATDLVSSPGLIAMILPSMTDIAPRVAATTKSLCTLNIVRSRISLSGRCLRGSSRVVWSSSFQSRVWPGMCSS